jgi:murein L,D-transpeptidase YafK
MKIFSHHRLIKPGLITLGTLILITVLPWSATALNRNSMPTKDIEQSTHNEHNVEVLMARSLMDITDGKIDLALNTLDQVIQIAPNFKLAQLVKGDLLMARGLQFQSFGTPNPNSTDVEGFRDEARKRVERYLAKDTPNQLPEPVWQLDERQPFIFVVDAEKARLFLYRNDNDHLHYVADFYVTIGKNGGEKKFEGDKRTPLGVYYTNARLTQKLADMYGDAAFPLSYPNDWDKRQGKTGGGIWIHGTPHDTYSRAPQSSDGCVVLSNQDLNTLMPILEKGNIPVIIGKDILWSKDTTNDKASLLDEIENWRKDWQSQNTDEYLSHYSSHFTSGTMDYNQWASEKRRIQSSKPQVDIKVSHISLIHYPNSEKNMIEVTFDQAFRSPVLDSQMKKRQYWINEDHQWKILYEGAA